MSNLLLCTIIILHILYYRRGLFCLVEDNFVLYEQREFIQGSDVIEPWHTYGIV